MNRIDGAKGRITGFGTLSTILIVLTVLVASVSVGGAVREVNQGTTQQATSIDSCTTIDEPGTYRLTESISNSTSDICINIQASDVHFDGGGHTIDGTITRQEIQSVMGPPETGIGVGVNLGRSSPLSNVTVTNVTTTDWFFGVRGEDVSGVTLRGLTGITNGVGMFVDSASSPVVENVTTTENVRFGTVVEESPNSTVQDVTANNNGFNGVFLVDSVDSTVRRVTATNNGFSGVELMNASESIVRNVTATGNDFRGLGVVEAPSGPPSGIIVENVTVVDNNFSQNGYSGIVVFNTTNSTFANNSVVGTKGTLPPGVAVGDVGRLAAGVYVESGSENVFTDTDARDQAAWAYLAENGATNTVENLRTDTATVTFRARDIGLGPTTTIPPNADDEKNGTILAGGVIVTNMSADAFIDLQVAWETAESEDQSTNETTTVSKAR